MALVKQILFNQLLEDVFFRGDVGLSGSALTIKVTGPPR
jgi:hypothetical protein